ncbi:MAG: gamma-glutamyl-gamma-aminobutyrate hydrolase family protein [Solibacillus sp.]
MKPIIGLTMHASERKLEVNASYIDSIEQAGGIPICLPFLTKEEQGEVLAKLDGLLVIGGHDVNPLFYGQQPHEKLGAVVTKRDESDLALIKHALQLDLPMLAICRGHQLLNVALGGTLIQDIPAQIQGAVLHTQRSARHEMIHTVELKTTTFQQIFGEMEIVTNSFHHQAVDNVGEGLVVAAVAKDGVIEGLEYPLASYCISVQWHPEELAMTNHHAKQLFLSFIEAANKKSAFAPACTQG